MTRRAGAGTPATVALTRAGVAFTLRPYPHDPRAESYGAEAAAALGVDPARVLKTLVVDAGTGLAVAVVPVAGRLDLKAAARLLGASRVALADPVVAERATGYVVGGISPLGQRRVLPTVVDEGALVHPTVLVSGGRRGLDLELDPVDLVRLTAAFTGPLAR